MAQKKRSFCATSLYELSETVLAKLEEYPQFISSHRVLLYYSLKDEVDTHSFIEKWYRQKEIILPVVTGDDLELRVYRGKESLEKGAYGILEPTGEKFTNFTSIDLAIIPGVAFDKEGNRLGRGKGYYDRLLPKINAYKMGICFPFQLINEVPAEPFDIKMDEVIA